MTTSVDLGDVGEKLAELSRIMLDQAALRGTEEASSGNTGMPLRVVHLRDVQEINEAIDAVLEDAKEEILTAQPDGPRPGPVLEDALESVRGRITGGVRMRTLYQHTARFDEPTKEYVRRVAEYGAEVRTLEEFFDRLIIIDKRIAFIAENDERTAAVAVEEPAVVRFLCDVFERSWVRAEPFPFVPVAATEAAREVIPAIRESIRRMLIEGHSDKHIARRLGISERSLQAHVASMKKQLKAHNRLHLGYLLGRNEAEYVL
ncbi:LuxR C-terminal-related transcriptional regulator [Streptomyces sp. yr375]|uniref:helix-turn-helix transcriptional regulator n=1 Tax=Streptomyces sp. yr375 TaxID=1761906 RepID=UPI0015A520CF|nr:LuxR C-terminal-related transcriptional regulator [Streptomyces sp. yr375]